GGRCEGLGLDCVKPKVLRLEGLTSGGLVMRVPVGWLQELFDAPLPAVPDLVEALNGLGLSVETVHEVAGAPADVVVAEVVSVSSLPDSDNLSEAVVRYPGADGTTVTVTVVCGAPNVAPGVVSALALPGARLPGVDEPVGERLIRGVPSHGMLASPKELGLYETTSGIITFGPDAKPGTRLADLWPSETVIELELTPNRGDAFSLLGVARDLAATLGVQVKHPAAGLDSGDAAVDDGLELDIRDRLGSPRFTLR